MKPVAKPVPSGGLYTIMKFGNEWFTMYPKVGERMDTHEPEFRVTSVKKVGRIRVLKTTQSGYPGFFKYGIREAQAIAPPGANAYEPVGEGWLDEKFAYWRAEFYKIEIDGTARLIREGDLVKDYRALMTLVERGEDDE